MSIDPPLRAFAGKDMSYVNALYALTEHADSLQNAKSLDQPNFQGLIDTADKVVTFFDSLDDFYVNYFDGQLIGVDFRYFPHLVTIKYDMHYGTGAAQQALNKYSKIPTDKRFDKNDICRFLKIRTPLAKL